MTLIRFQDNTYGSPSVVSAEDLTSALQRGKRLVALRHPDGTKLSDDGVTARLGRATCILLGYIPLSAQDEALACVAPKGARS
jgi:hypothetical protein